MQILGEAPEGSGADAEVRFRKVPVQRLGQVPGASGADYQVRIRKVPVQGLGEFWRVPVQIPVQMRRSGSGRLRCRG